MIYKISEEFKIIEFLSVMAKGPARYSLIWSKIRLHTASNVLENAVPTAFSNASKCI